MTKTNPTVTSRTNLFSSTPPRRFELCIHWLRPYGLQSDAAGGTNLEDGDCVNDYDVGTVAIPVQDNPWIPITHCRVSGFLH